MPSRTYVAHDQAVSVVRMYLQMAAIGLIVGTGLYGGLMAGFLSHWVSGPIPELREVDGRSRLMVTPSSPRLPLSALVKYYVSLNPANYVSTNLNPARQAVRTDLEQVEKELLPLLQNSKVPREQYRQFVRLITRGRVTHLRWIVPCSLLFFPVFGVLYFLAFRTLNKRASKTRFVRGADMVPLHQMRLWLQAAIETEKTQKQATRPLQLGAVLLSEEVSRRHIFVAGTSGTGKSVCLNHYIRSLNHLKVGTTQPSKSVIYDVKGEFTGKHSQPGDVIFCPFDQRSVGWSFFNEVHDYPDLDVLCTSLYEPPKDSKDAYWYNAARDVFRTGLFYLLREKKTKNRDIWEFFSQPLHQIRDCMYSLPIRELGALKHIDKADSNQAASVISILQERLTFFRYLTDSDGDFSFRRFIQDETERRSLFLMNIRQYDAIFRPLMTFVIDVMIREVLSLPDSFTRRITFLIDEFGSLSKMTSIFDFLTMARSKGGFLVLANQDLGSVSNVSPPDSPRS